MSGRVFLHVGTPKSGTTYLQVVLWHNADLLRSHRLLLPGRFQAHYAAAKGVTSRRGMRRQIAVDMDTAWSTLVRQINDWPHDALISHELLAPASADQAHSARSMLQGEIHVVLTARALHKQLPASWQQQVKGGLATPYDRFLSRVRSGSAKGAWFWEVQDLADIADRWAGSLPARQVHVVTVPRDSSASSLLWQRYAGVLGLEPTAYDIDVSRKNVSLGVVECELLRRLHALRDYRFTDADRHAWTRKLLAAEILGQRHSAPIATPHKAQNWLEKRSSSMLSELETKGYNVAGSLRELEWESPPTHARPPSSVSQAELEEATSWTIDRLREVLSSRYPERQPPVVNRGEGLPVVLDLLECLRAADTGTSPRPAPPQRDLERRTESR